MWINRSSHLLLTAILVSGLALTIGCGDDDSADSSVDVQGLDLIDRDADDDGELAAYVHGEHWHGSPLQVVEDPDDRRSLGVAFLDADDEYLDLDLGDDYTVELHAHGNDDNVDYTNHGDHFHLTGLAEGDVELHITLYADGVEIYEAPPLAVEVVHDDHGHEGGELHVSYFEILDRDHDPHAQIAYVDGDHWHGNDEIDIMGGGDPDDYDTGAVGESNALSIGAFAEESHDDHDHEITLNGSPYQLEATLTDASYEDYLYISHSHGDHVHFVGLMQGHAHVEFHIVDTDADEVVYTSPEVEFDVHGE